MFLQTLVFGKLVNWSWTNLLNLESDGLLGGLSTGEASHGADRYVAKSGVRRLVNAWICLADG